MPVRFSIVVPTKDRAALLDRCLGAMCALDYERQRFELLVVDDGSTPPPDAVIARHAQSLPLRYLSAGGRGPAAARNVALRLAQGEYVVFTDDDCQPHAHWLRAFDEAIGQDASLGAGFGGRIVDAPENGICGRTSQMLVTFLYEYNALHNRLLFFCSNNLAFPRLELLEMGGFDESFPLAAAEDRYICARWLKRWKLIFVPAALVSHRQNLDLRAFFRQQYRYGRGACQFWRRRQLEENLGVRLEPWHFYSRMLLYPFTRVGLAKAVVMSALLALSQVACALGYFAEASSTSPSAGR